MRDTMKKRFAVLVGAALLAASGGAALPVKPVFAASANVSASAADTSNGLAAQPEIAPDTTQIDYIDILAGGQLTSIVAQAAAIAGKDYDTLMQDVIAGKSLADAAGLSAGELESQLLRSAEQSLNVEAATGALTAAEAEQAKTSAAEAIRAVVSGTQGAAKPEASWLAGSDIVQSHLNQIVDDIAYAYELDARDLRAALHEGQSLIEASGQAADALENVLSESLNRDLDTAVQTGKLTAADADKRKEKGRDAITTIVTTPGYDRETTPWMEQYGNALLANRLDFAENTAFALSDKEYDDFYNELGQGGTLLSASGLTESELLEPLAESIDQAIDAEWLNGRLSADLADRLKQQASEQLKTVIVTPGYGVTSVAETVAPTPDYSAATVTDDVYDGEADPVAVVTVTDVQAYTDERLSRVVADVAALTGLHTDELLARLAEGESLAEAAHSDNDTLLYGLVRSFGRQLNESAAAGAPFTKQESEQAKASYTSSILALLKNE